VIHAIVRAVPDGTRRDCQVVGNTVVARRITAPTTAAAASWAPRRGATPIDHGEDDVVHRTARVGRGVAVGPQEGHRAPDR